MPTLLPTVFVGHGGGPLPLLGDAEHRGLVRTWQKGSAVRAELHSPAVRAVLVVSAHHESGGGEARGQL